MWLLHDVRQVLCWGKERCFFFMSHHVHAVEACSCEASLWRRAGVSLGDVGIWWALTLRDATSRISAGFFKKNELISLSKYKTQSHKSTVSEVTSLLLSSKFYVLSYKCSQRGHHLHHGQHQCDKGIPPRHVSAYRALMLLFCRRWPLWTLVRQEIKRVWVQDLWVLY